MSPYSPDFSVNTKGSLALTGRPTTTRLMSIIQPRPIASPPDLDTTRCVSRQRDTPKHAYGCTQLTTSRHPTGVTATAYTCHPGQGLSFHIRAEPASTKHQHTTHNSSPTPRLHRHHDFAYQVLPNEFRAASTAHSGSPRTRLTA